MAKVVKGALLAGVVTLALASVASAQVTDAEFKCQRLVNKAGSKFISSKVKCTSKCIGNAVKGANPFSDCFAPYAGATAQCIHDAVFDIKGAEDKFRDAIRKACDPGFKVGTDCPECYSEGDCSPSGEADNRVQNIEGQVDSFVPGVFCDQPGSDAAETACEINTFKTLSKLIASVNRCYDKCNANARKGIGTFAACAPPASDPVTAACLNTASAKSVAGVNKKCGDVIPSANPDCPGPNQYPNGAVWTNLVVVWFSGNIPGTYCESPSGAFLD